MNQENLPVETTHNIAGDRVRLGLFTSIVGLVIFIIGAKPEWFGLSLAPTVGFVQITVLLIGLGIICLGGYVGLAALWGGQEKSIAADIGSRLIGTGYVISVFSGLADVFGMSVKDNSKLPFFGPWQAAGVGMGMLIIAIGVLLIIPYQHLKNQHQDSNSIP
jgi:hypothetical protein